MYVCMHVCVCVSSVTLMHHVQAAGRNEMPFGRDTRVVPSNIVLWSGAPRSVTGRGNFWPRNHQFAAMPRLSPNYFGRCYNILLRDNDVDNVVGCSSFWHQPLAFRTLLCLSRPFRWRGVPAVRWSTENGKPIEINRQVLHLVSTSGEGWLDDVTDWRCYIIVRQHQLQTFRPRDDGRAAANSWWRVGLYIVLED